MDYFGPKLSETTAENNPWLKFEYNLNICEGQGGNKF